jgi:hypothetical protein
LVVVAVVAVVAPVRQNKTPLLYKFLEKARLDLSKIYGTPSLSKIATYGISKPLMGSSALARIRRETIGSMV